ncbi:MAG: anti-sigma factor [Azospirillaceae bacterium]
MSEKDLSDELLNAYLDGELSPAEAADVARLIAACPDKSARLITYRRIDQGLSVLYGGASEPAPRPVAAGRTRPGRWWLPLAACLLLAIGAAGGWGLRGLDGPGGEEQAEARIATLATDAHTVFVRENRHAVEVTAEEDEHLFRWLSNRLERDIFAPPLTDYGFALVGGRMLANETGPAAQFMYENAEEMRLTLYVSRSTEIEQTAFQVTEHDGVRAFYWVHEGFGYALVGPLARAEMLAIAQRVYDDLEGPAG